MTVGSFWPVFSAVYATAIEWVAGHILEAHQPHPLVGLQRYAV
ncbi:hypothetical protein [Gemmiger sp.]